MSYSQRRSSRTYRSRSSSRGDRSPSHRSTSRYGKASEESSREGTKAQSKTSFWSKLLSFFGIKKSRASSRASSRTSSRGRGVSSSSGQIQTEPEPLNPESITTQRLYVGNLSYDTTESDLYNAFTRYGVVKNVEVIMDRRTQRSKGFGFVEMETLADARKAAAAMHRIEFMGRTIVVSGAKADPASATVREVNEKSSNGSPSTNATEAASEPLQQDKQPPALEGAATEQSSATKEPEPTCDTTSSEEKQGQLL